MRSSEAGAGGGLNDSGRSGRRRRELLGVSLTALCGGALALNMVLILGLLGVIGYQGGRFFWQKELPEFTLVDGGRILAEVRATDARPADLSAGGAGARGERLQLRLGNRDLTGGDFRWVDAAAIARRELPRDAVLLERLEWGNFYGRMVELRHGPELLAQGSEAVWKAFPALHAAKLAERREIAKLEKGAIGAAQTLAFKYSLTGAIGEVNLAIEKLRLDARRLELAAPAADIRARRQAEIDQALARRQAEYETLSTALFAQRERLSAETVVMEAADGTRKEIPVGAIVRAIRPNEMGVVAKLGLYASRVREFVSPRSTCASTPSRGPSSARCASRSTTSPACRRSSSASSVSASSSTPSAATSTVCSFPRRCRHRPSAPAASSGAPSRWRCSPCR